MFLRTVCCDGTVILLNSKRERERKRTESKDKKNEDIKIEVKNCGCIFVASFALSHSSPKYHFLQF